MKKLENLSSRITSLMFGMSRHMLHRMKEHETKVVFSFSQIAALRCMAERGKTTMKELADCMQITPPSATSLVNGLAKSGYVTRKADPKDRRTVYLALTAKGRLYNHRCYKAKELGIKHMIKNLNQKEKQLFADLLTKINQVSNDN